LCRISSFFVAVTKQFCSAFEDSSTIWIKIALFHSETFNYGVSKWYELAAKPKNFGCAGSPLRRRALLFSMKEVADSQKRGCNQANF
jgi:hypothetical protein